MRFLIIIFILFFCLEARTEGLKGLNEFDIIVAEVITDTKGSCGVTINEIDQDGYIRVEEKIQEECLSL